jgi:unsaturated rhamnogalacturonyl hydrolase
MRDALGRFVCFVAICMIAFVGHQARGADAEAAGDASSASSSSAAPAESLIGAGKVVGLDYFFNHQVLKGRQYHYVWEDTKNTGFSKFGEVWKSLGAALAKVDHSPRAADLAKLSIYIICDPNTPEKAADHKPNYIDPGAIAAIDEWVQSGGVLMLMGNDVHNCEFDHLNQLSQTFGITFNRDDRNLVPTKADMIQGTFAAKDFPDHPIFAGVKMIYVKEICTLSTRAPAGPLLVADKQPGESGEGKDTIMAISHFGKGLVFAVGDPWFYNEYIDVRTTALPIENRKAARNLAAWLLGPSRAVDAGGDR